MFVVNSITPESKQTLSLISSKGKAGISFMLEYSLGVLVLLDSTWYKICDQ